jgi:hypothetical protein
MAIEQHIAAMEGTTKKAVLPPSADPYVISSIIDMSAGSSAGCWR